jgi:selenocysteine-specific elongation factor
MDAATSPHHPNDPPGASDTPFVIGTAGHVDHGKSTLVRALTGIDPDRLAEEREREMTIDLGFAWLTLPDGRDVSIVDVPGHERFVRNMLAGVGGIDLAMLVIAADDGPMPQTREHLAIIDLLGIERGVVAITRTDLVDDEWRDLVMEEARELIQDTSIAGAPIVAVSAVTGEGLDELRAVLAAELDRAVMRDAGGRARLPIDRAFQVAGFGTVVTGTLISGEVHTGQELMLYPERRPFRIRGIQAHRRQVDRASAGSRVALNLSGIGLDEVRRGHVIALPRALTPTMRLDVRLRVLDDAPAMVAQNDEVIVFIGSAEVPARLSLLDREEIGPGEEGWVQLRLTRPATALRGDRVILRRPSPAVTIGGGVVVDPDPARHRRFRPEVIAHLDVLQQGAPEELITQALGDGLAEVAALARTVGVPDVENAIAAMIASGELVALGDAPASSRTSVMRASVFERLARTLEEYLAAYHARHPLSPGPRRDELRGPLGLASAKIPEDLVRAFERAGTIRIEGPIVALPNFSIELDREDRATADAFLAAARAAPFGPPAPATAGVGEGLLNALETTGEIVRVADQIAYPADVFDRIRTTVLEMIDRDGAITLAGYRDQFDTSRKYAQPTLEYLDEQRITRRTGDARVRFRGRAVPT